jgi:hypothetical protein
MVPSTYRLFSTTALLALPLLLCTGCNSSGIYPVTGKITFKEGMPPAAEVAVVRFEPVGGGDPEKVKPASGRIQPDGSYRLTTLEPDDGAFVGEYKVTFTILKTYQGRESLIDRKYTLGSSTPFTAKVEAGGSNEFDFELPLGPAR